MNKQTDDISCKITIKRIFNGCPKQPSGWFGCFAKIHSASKLNLREEVKIYGFENQIPVPLTNGLQLEVTIKKSSRYEDGYDIVFASLVTKTKSGTISYLASLPGVSRYIAQKVVNYYMKNAIDIIKYTPEKMQNDLNLSEKQINALHIGVLQADLENSIRQLAPELDAKQTNLIKKSLKNPLEVIKNDTYKLYLDLNIPFKTVDTIAQRLNPNPFFPKRIYVGILHCVKQMTTSSGNLFVNLSNDSEFYRLLNDVEFLLHFQFMKDQAGVQFGSWIMAAANDPESNLHIDKYNNETHLYVSNMFYAMQSIVAHFNVIKTQQSRYHSFTNVIANGGADKALNLSIYDWELATNKKLTPEQENAVRTAIVNRCSVITGGPGRGKTCVIDCIAKCWPGNVKLLAPTGKAMNKLRSETHEKYSTETIDRMLVRFSHAHDKRQKDEIAKTNQPSTLVIIDESSMIDVMKAYEIITNLSHCQIVFVGDVDQLPPINPGYFLKDIIESQCVPIAYLTIPQRNGGLILSNADKINANDINLQYDFNEMPFYPQANDDNNALNFILEQYNDEREDCPDITQIALLCPTRRGNIGVISLNFAIQNIACPLVDTSIAVKDKRHEQLLTHTTKGYPIPGTIYGDSSHWDKFRIGDIVMNTQNNPEIETVKYDNNDFFNGKPKDPSIGIYNGDCGRIIAYRPKQQDIYDDDYPNTIIVQFFDGRVAELDMDTGEFDSFHLGYAMTVHKSQGCEYQTVIYVSPNSLSYMTESGFACKNLVYTAVTRAKQRVVIIGSKDSLNACIQTNIPPKNSNLAERLK